VFISYVISNTNAQQQQQQQQFYKVVMAQGYNNNDHYGDNSYSQYSTDDKN
jgi:hypothetical protein